MAKTSAAKIAANNRYSAKAYDRISLMVKKGEREKIQNHALWGGETTNAFINRAIKETMERDLLTSDPY